MQTLRITLTEELEQILNMLQLRYPTLSKVEITKLALGEMQRTQQAMQKAGSLQTFFNKLPVDPSLDEETAMQIAVEEVQSTRSSRI